MSNTNDIAARISAVRKIEYQGKPVATYAMIDELHGHQPGVAKQAYFRNKEQFFEGRDYFDLASSEFDGNESLPSNGKAGRGGYRGKIRVYTRDGYMKLVKIFSDDLSWEIHGHMVAIYFAAADSILKVDIGKQGVQVSRELPPAVESAIKALVERPELLQAIPALLEALGVSRTTFSPGEMIPEGRRIKLCRIVREIVDKEGMHWIDRRGKIRPVDESRVVRKMVSKIAVQAWTGVCRPMQADDNAGTWIGHVDDEAKYVEAFWDAAYELQRFVRKVSPQRKFDFEQN